MTDQLTLINVPQIYIEQALHKSSRYQHNKYYSLWINTFQKNLIEIIFTNRLVNHFKEAKVIKIRDTYLIPLISIFKGKLFLNSPAPKDISNIQFAIAIDKNKKILLICRSKTNNFLIAKEGKEGIILYNYASFIKQFNNKIYNKKEKYMSTKKNLWILTEERPKIEVLEKILHEFILDHNISCFVDPLRIIPILTNEKNFIFTYEVKGVDSQSIDKIYIKIISGKGSFVDFLIYYQNNLPTPKDQPIYGIEETKTDDSESRNTGIFQRAIKFYFLELFYPKIKKIMLYNIRVKEKIKVSKSNDFGTRCLLTLGVKIIGKSHYNKKLKKFNSVKELISDRKKVPPPRSGKRINVTRRKDKITISGKLYKPTNQFSDPSMGTIGLIITTLRTLEFNNEIEVINHELRSRQFSSENKFMSLCSLLKVKIRGKGYLNINKKPEYWEYDLAGEKNATIFLHVLTETFNMSLSLFENHAGSEKGYFYASNGEIKAVAKKINPKTLKADSSGIKVPLPDLVLLDKKNQIILNIEGEKFINVKSGIDQLKGFDKFEEYYIKKNGYDSFDIERSVVLFGGSKNTIETDEVSFILNDQGQLVLKINSPELFKESIEKLKKYWN